MLQDSSILIGQKLVENAKNWKTQMGHFGWFSNTVRYCRRSNTLTNCENCIVFIRLSNNTTECLPKKSAKIQLDNNVLIFNGRNLIWGKKDFVYWCAVRPLDSPHWAQLAFSYVFIGKKVMLKGLGIHSGFSAEASFLLEQMPREERLTGFPRDLSLSRACNRLSFTTDHNPFSLLKMRSRIGFDGGYRW